MQRLLDIPIAADRHLLPIQTVMCSTGLHEDTVVYHIEEGRFSHAWDIAYPGTRRRMIRIWRVSLGDFISGRATTADEAEALEQIFPSSRTDFRSTEVSQKWVCSSTHVLDLCRCGELITSTPATAGINGYARITRASLIQFLQSRRIL